MDETPTASTEPNYLTLELSPSVTVQEMSEQLTTMIETVKEKWPSLNLSEFTFKSSSPLVIDLGNGISKTTDIHMIYFKKEN